MPLSLPARARIAVVACSLAFTGLVLAQNTFSPGGPEYSVIGPAVGDQVLPQAAVSATGGWVVWQDNAADGEGAGIRGLRVDGNFQPAADPLRINVEGRGEQERPAVALLPGGGAVVVWQGGPVGFQNIFARFFNASGQPTTGDLLVNSVTNRNQSTPVVAVNPAGLVMVVWAGFDVQLSGDAAADRLSGIYGQAFNASGAKNGANFRLNVATANNQRSPAVTALADGRFVAGWISERQRASGSVDLYCRTIAATGVPAGGEFVVNASTAFACANPSLAASPDGGFLVAWSQNSGTIRTEASPSVWIPGSEPAPNGWDVFFRHYGANGLATAPARQLNTFSYGDQFAPRIAAFGRDYLATWVSLGQDGSREGVYGQFFSSAGFVEGEEFRVNTAAISRQIHPALATDGVNRFMVVWSTFNAGSSFDVVARAYDIIRVSTVAVPGGLQLSWNTMPGSVYQVQTSVNLGAWTNLGSQREAGGLSDSMIFNPGDGAAIFRVVRVR